MHLVYGDRGRLPQRWMADSWLDRLADQSVLSAVQGSWRDTIRRCGDHKNEAAGRVVTHEVDGPSELTGENQGDNKVDITSLTGLQDSNEFLLKAELFNLLALLLAVLVAMILDLNRQVLGLARLLTSSNDLNDGSDGSGHRSAE